MIIDYRKMIKQKIHISKESLHTLTLTDRKANKGAPAQLKNFLGNHLYLLPATL